MEIHITEADTAESIEEKMAAIGRVVQAMRAAANIDAATDIVSDLAQAPNPAARGDCGLCGDERGVRLGGEFNGHIASCPWVRARAVLK